jgi:DNA polymerase III delta prime subunit
MAGRIQFKKATKLDARLRLALAGSSGSGKTYTALALATELAGEGGKIAYVDTERGSASKYANKFEFDVIEPEKFDPRELIETLAAAAEAGYKVGVVDSLSHYWMGKGGELEMVDAATSRERGNSFAGWKHVTPVHNDLIHALLSSPMHIIVTMRTKTEWVIEKDQNGRNAPRKVGMQPIMRDGIEFEFDVCGDMSQENALTVTKSRCPELTGQVIQRPGKQMADTLKVWLVGDVPPPAVPVVEVTSEQLQATSVESTPIKAQVVDEKPKDRFKEMLAQFADIKTKVSAAQYYDILKQFGVAHANDFRDMTLAKNCYRALKVAATVNGPAE